MQIRCADEKRGVKKGIPSTVVELQSMKSKVDGKERYLPLTVELRVRQDGGHDGCSMSGRVAVHGPDDLHAHQALTTCTRHAGHSVTARLGAYMQITAVAWSAAGGQSPGGCSVKPQTASKMPAACFRWMTCVPGYEGRHAKSIHPKMWQSAEDIHQQMHGELHLAAQ